MMSLRRIGLVAQRDFAAIVRTRTFAIGLVGFLIAVTLAPLVVWIAQWRSVSAIGVIDPTGGYLPRLQQATPASSPHRFVGFNASSPQDRQYAMEAVRKRTLAGLVEVKLEPDGEETFSITLANLADPLPRRFIREMIVQVASTRRAQRLGISPEVYEKLTADFVFENQRITSGASRTASETDFFAAVMLPMGLVLALYGLISFQSERLLTALMEEKLKRLLEVLLTRMTIAELLLGKMLGILCVGFLLYGGILIVTAAALWQAGLIFWIHLGQVMIFGAFYILGYLLYASFYAAIGAMCTNPKDADNLSMPMRTLLFLPILISVYIHGHSESFTTQFFSIFPLTAPFVMSNRLVITQVPALEVVWSLISTAATAFLVFWAATRLYRASLLAPHRSLRWKDIRRWLARLPRRSILHELSS